MKRPNAPHLLVALGIVLLVGGCGGDSSSSSNSNSAGNGGDAPGRAAGDQSNGPNLRRAEIERRLRRFKRELEAKAAGEEKQSAESAQNAPPTRPDGPAPTVTTPLPNEGTKAVAPSVPTAKGGDNSVQEFGVEASSGERVRAARAFQAYLDARVAGQWAQACAYLSAKARAGLGLLGGRASACAPAMRAVFARAPRSTLRTAADIRVLSLRVRGSRTLLVYTDGRGTPSVIPMARAGGAWRVASVLGAPLPL